MAQSSIEHPSERLRDFRKKASCHWLTANCHLLAAPLPSHIRTDNACTPTGSNNRAEGDILR
jgi:hypothetical protein